MATTTVNDAVVIPQAQGTGLGSEDDVIDAASAALLAENVNGDAYVRTGMGFTRDDANDQIQVGSGICYIVDDSSSTGGSRGSGGNAQVQSTSSSGYDTEIPGNQIYCVIFPSAVNVAVTDNTLSNIWINITDVTSNVTVEDAANGQVEYAFATNDLDTVGLFEYEWEVTFAGGEVRTYPNDRDGVVLRVVEEGS